MAQVWADSDTRSRRPRWMVVLREAVEQVREAGKAYRRAYDEQDTYAQIQSLQTYKASCDFNEAQRRLGACWHEIDLTLILVEKQYDAKLREAMTQVAPIIVQTHGKGD